jgi:hypothetical protein
MKPTSFEQIIYKKGNDASNQRPRIPINQNFKMPAQKLSGVLPIPNTIKNNGLSNIESGK